MDKLREFLTAQGLTQREAADKLGVTEEYLSRILNGKTPLTNAIIGRVGNIFGFAVAQQIFNHEQEQPA